MKDVYYSKTREIKIKQGDFAEYNFQKNMEDISKWATNPKFRWELKWYEKIYRYLTWKFYKLTKKYLSLH